MTKQEQKDVYVAPSIDVLEMENEGGVMSLSAPDFLDGDSMVNRYPGVGIRYNNSPATDLEELINNILTTKE